MDNVKKVAHSPIAVYSCRDADHLLISSWCYIMILNISCLSGVLWCILQEGNQN
uniref:Uncharacterized protein n=1 Tax=Anguilla anguilla TaxID=7936 RepID=A0A0E9SUD6_ANGAN